MKTNTAGLSNKQGRQERWRKEAAPSRAAPAAPVRCPAAFPRTKGGTAPDCARRPRSCRRPRQLHAATGRVNADSAPAAVRREIKHEGQLWERYRPCAQIANQARANAKTESNTALHPSSQQHTQPDHMPAQHASTSTVVVRQGNDRAAAERDHVGHVCKHESKYKQHRNALRAAPDRNGKSAARAKLDTAACSRAEHSSRKLDHPQPATEDAHLSRWGPSW